MCVVKLPLLSLGEAAAAVERHRASHTPPPAAEASLPPAPASEASLTSAPAAAADALLTPEASLTPAPAPDASHTPLPAVEASPYDWRKEEQERSREADVFLATFDPEVYLPFMLSPFTELRKHFKEDTESSEEPVIKSWMDEYIESLEPKCRDPAILEARYRFLRLEEKEEAMENGMKWMKKDVLQAFEIYRSSAGYNKNFEYKFVKLDHQCLIYDTFSKSYHHHHNFTMRTKWSWSTHWNYQTFFAEVKPTEKGKDYFCCPLLPTENGHCSGCRKVGISLRHPDIGRYEKGHADSGFLFDTDGDTDD